MACFMVPATEAIVTTVMTKVVEKKEKKAMGFLRKGSYESSK